MLDTSWLLLPGLGFAAAGFTGAVNSRARKRCLDTQLRGLQAARQVKHLLADVQMHRGMVNTYLSGDKSFQTRLVDKQAQIDRDLAALDAQLSELGLAGRRWQGIRSTWDNLRQKAVSLSLQQSFDSHSLMIRSVLYFMGDVAERCRIAADCPAGTTLVPALWSHLPATAEGLGQARGLGAGVAARGRCSSVTRIKLRFLQERIATTMQRVDHDLAGSGVVQTLGATLTRSWTGTHRTVNDFLAMLERELINAATPAIAADQFFQVSTQAIDAVFGVFDQASETMEQLIRGGARAVPG